MSGNLLSGETVDRTELMAVLGKAEKLLKDDLADLESKQELLIEIILICGKQKQDSPNQWAKKQYNLANIYSRRIKGDPSENAKKSIEYYLAALQIYTANEFLDEWAFIQIQLARFSISQLHNYRIAIEHLQAAYEKLSANNSNIDLLAQTMFELARCFHQTGALGYSKIYFKDSIRLFQKLEKPLQVAAANSALGNLELQMGYLDDARIHLQIALEFYQNAGNADRIQSIQELQQYILELDRKEVVLRSTFTNRIFNVQKSSEYCLQDIIC
jgi:tetratricopeptide (TPR) repeat protein